MVGCSLLAPPRRADTSSGVQAREVEPMPAREDDEPKKRLVVLPFLDERSARSSQASDVARQSVVRELVQTRRFVVINPQDLPQDLLSKRNENNDYDLEKIAPQANSIGSAAVIEGKVLDIRVRRMGDPVGLIRKLNVRVDATIRIRAVASRNGKEILNETRSASVESASTRFGDESSSDKILEDDPQLIRQAVQKAFSGSLLGLVKSVEKLSWEGRVAMVSGDRIYVNAGRLSGLLVGDILKVLEEGEEVHDPETGLFIGAAPGRLKGTLEIVSYFGKDGAIGIIHSGSGFRENDLVEIY